ncbi:OmpA family protein [Pseudoalteromonas aliena]|uniref:OmpA family protein n=1 Tax=Pseudoalteromonas aliena TaxID=247523 RepID=UPI00311E8E58
MSNIFIPIKLLICCLFLAITINVVNAKEQNFTQSYEKGLWSTKENSFFCHLGQTFDEYASLEVISVPAEPQKLVLKWLLSDKKVTDVQVFSRKADWQSKSISPPQLNLFTADISNNAATFDVDESTILRVIKQGGWLDSVVGFGDEQLRLTFTNILSDDAVGKYQHCLSNLSPLSWKQARDHEIHFQTGKRTVDKQEDLDFLKDLVRYVLLDKDVTKVMVDGHTDNVGSPLANRLLSKERADDVASRLVEFGLPKDMLEVRAHGQRYPVAKNSNKGLASNRRVLIRLFRHSN